VGLSVYKTKLFKILVMNCNNCSNTTVMNVDRCPKCLSELGKYPLSKMSKTRINYEISIIDGLAEQDQERPFIIDYLKQLIN
jgi:uncharacterized OB-fold protein